MIKIIKKKIVVVDHLKIFDLNIVGINGTIKIISTSKTIKIMAIKKNCIEKGIRAKLKKLNPHSNGIAFSRNLFLFFEIDIEINIKIIVTVNEVKIIKKKIKI